MRRLLALAITVILTAALLAADAPKAPTNVLMKPTFLLANESWSAGTAFLLRLDKRSKTLLVTCHHLFGPAAGLAKQMSDREIRNVVRGAVGPSMEDRKTIVCASTYVGVSEARGVDGAGAEKDLAVFVVQSGSDLAALEFAEQRPRVGDSVHMFARLRSEADPRMISATVTEVEPNWLLYAFKDKGIDLRGTSGAPVLDERGRVVGMNVGGNEQNGQTVGIANPAERMRELIKLPHD